MMEEKKFDKGTNESRTCGVCTCIHCIVNTCSLDKCDMFENRNLQEG